MESKKKGIVGISFVVVVTTLLLTTSNSFASGRGAPAGQPFQALQQAIDYLSEAVDGLVADLAELRADLAELAPEIAELRADVTELRDVLTVQVAVDTEACASVPVQCRNFSYRAATNQNNNPLRIVVHVTKNGQPVNGLSYNDFLVSNPFVPAGGGQTGKCGSDDCTSDHFKTAHPGIYMLWLKQLPPGNWKAGSYGGVVSAVDGDGNRGATLLNFTIPEGI